MRTKAATAVQKDWHPADVVAALRKRNVSLRQLARQNNYSHIDRVLRTPWLAAEQIVAKALGIKPAQIWPSRYADPESRRRGFQLTRKIEVAMPKATPAKKGRA